MKLTILVNKDEGLTNGFFYLKLDHGMEYFGAKEFNLYRDKVYNNLAHGVFLRLAHSQYRALNEIECMLFKDKMKGLIYGK